MNKCKHKEAYLEELEAFNPDDGTVYGVRCDECNLDGMSGAEMDELYEELSW